MHSSRVKALAVVFGVVALAGACSGSSSKSGSSTGTTTAGGSKVTLRLGYLPNVTHAPAIVGLQNKTYENDLGANVDLKTTTYNSGTDETTAILSTRSTPRSSVRTPRSTPTKSRTAR